MAKGGSKGLQRVVAQQSVNAGIQATTLERKAFGLGSIAAASGKLEQGDESIYVALKYYDSGHECFSAWTADELSEFSAFIDKLRQQTWNNLSVGIRPKPCDIRTAQNGAQHRLKGLRDRLSNDIDFIEMRVSRRARVHGFRMKNAFFLVLLDRDHQVFPE